MIVPLFVNPCGSAIVGQPAAGKTPAGGGGGGGGGGGAGGLLIVMLPPAPGEAISLAPQAANVAQVAVTIMISDKRLIEAIKSPLRRTGLLNITSEASPNH